jgi:hypothetical protein
MDYQFGLLCALQANMHRARGKPPLTPQDFMMFQPEDPAAKERKMQAEFEAFVKTWNNSAAPAKPDGQPRLS